MSERLGCSNHCCYIRKPEGMATNGPCHCLDPLGRANALAIKQKLFRLSQLERRQADFNLEYYNVPARYHVILGDIYNAQGELVCSCYPNGERRFYKLTVKGVPEKLFYLAFSNVIDNQV